MNRYLMIFISILPVVLSSNILHAEWYRIINQATGKCMDAYETHEGPHVRQHDCWGNKDTAPQQFWRFNDDRTIENKKSGLVISISDNSEEISNVVQCSRSDSSSCKWLYCRDLIFLNEAKDRMLEVFNGEEHNGRQIGYTPTAFRGILHAKWRVEPDGGAQEIFGVIQDLDASLRDYSSFFQSLGDQWDDRDQVLLERKGKRAKECLKKMEDLQDRHDEEMLSSVFIQYAVSTLDLNFKGDILNVSSDPKVHALQLGWSAFLAAGSGGGRNEVGQFGDGDLSGYWRECREHGMVLGFLGISGGPSGAVSGAMYGCAEGMAYHMYKRVENYLEAPSEVNEYSDLDNFDEPQNERGTESESACTIM